MSRASRELTSSGSTQPWYPQQEHRPVLATVSTTRRVRQSRHSMRIASQVVPIQGLSAGSAVRRSYIGTRSSCGFSAATTGSFGIDAPGRARAAHARIEARLLEREGFRIAMPKANIPTL
jgi:hypothetical protein